MVGIFTRWIRKDTTSNKEEYNWHLLGTSAFSSTHLNRSSVRNQLNILKTDWFGFLFIKILDLEKQNSFLIGIKLIKFHLKIITFVLKENLLKIPVILI